MKGTVAPEEFSVPPVSAPQADAARRLVESRCAEDAPIVLDVLGLADADDMAARRRVRYAGQMMLRNAVMNSDGWRWIATDAAEARVLFPYGSEPYSVLTRLIAVAGDLARILDEAAAIEASA